MSCSQVMTGVLVLERCTGVGPSFVLQRLSSEGQATRGGIAMTERDRNQTDFVSVPSEWKAAVPEAEVKQHIVLAPTNARVHEAAQNHSRLFNDKPCITACRRYTLHRAFR